MIWVQWRVCRHFLVTAHPAWPLTWASDTVTEWKLRLETDILIARLSPNWSIKTRNCPLCPWAGMTEPPQDPASPLAGGRTEKVCTQLPSWWQDMMQGGGRGQTHLQTFCIPSGHLPVTDLRALSIFRADLEVFSCRAQKSCLDHSPFWKGGHVTPKFCFLFLSPVTALGQTS